MQESVITPAQIQVNAFVGRVYRWMTTAMVISGLAAYFTVSSEAFAKALFQNSWLFFGLIIAELGLVIYLSTAIRSMSVRAAMVSFILYAALTGVTLSSVLLIYTTASILRVFFVTALTFGGMSLYGATTKRDLSALGNFLIMSLIGLIIASVVNIFMQSHFLDWVTTYAGIIIFAGLTAWDTQKLRYYGTSGTFGNIEKAAIFGALALYLDFINLFLFLLRAMGSRR